MSHYKTDLIFPFWIDDLLFLSLKLSCLLMYTVCVTVNYLYDSFVLSDFAPLCGIDSEPRRSGAPWTGLVDDAIGVKWISDRVFNHGPGKKKSSQALFPHIDPWPLHYIAVLLYMPNTTASILLAKLDSLRVMKTKVAVIGLNRWLINICVLGVVVN